MTIGNFLQSLLSVLNAMSPYLLLGFGREVYFDSTIFLPAISVYFLILLSKMSILSVDRTQNFASK